MGEVVFLQGGRAGDLICNIPAMMDLAKRRGATRFTLLLKENMPVGDLLPHVCGRVLMDKRMCESLITLLKVQTYISDCRIWKGEPGIDLDRFRWQPFDFTRGDIGTWITSVYLCTPDFTRPWLSVGTWYNKNERILVGRSPRYRNNSLRYHELDFGLYDVRYLGLHSENDTCLPGIEPPDILGMAREIISCKLFIGNQSLGSAIAAGLDQRRILEVCRECPNVMAHTPRCQLIWNQEQLQEAIHDL